MKHKDQLTIEDAIENLSSLSELKDDDKITVSEGHHLLHVESADLTEREIQLLDEQENDKTISVVKETFKVVFNYVKRLYRKEYGVLTNKKAIEGIKTIMVLVGDAAKSLEKYTSLFQGVHSKQPISKMKEYRQLQNFYRKKIASEVLEERILSEMMHPLEDVVGLEEKNESIGRDEVEEGLDDLTVVKQDLEYEFFFLKKEDGERFFNSRILRNIKLACDFGEDVDVGEFSEDPLIYIKNWQDKDFQITAKNILKAVRSPLHTFYADAMRFKEMDMVMQMNKIIMALMMSANPKNLLRHSSAKSCYRYFGDFLVFLRQVLNSRDYQKMIAYPPDKSKKFLQTIMELIHSLCRSLYTHVPAKQELTGMICHLAGVSDEKKNRSNKFVSNCLQEDYESIVKVLRCHPNGPLFKVFDLLQEEDIPLFDTLMLDNIPHNLYDLYLGGQKISHIRLASPTYQEYVDKAYVVSEFKGMLRSYSKDNIEKRHLLFNLQDRTSWKEHSRCSALEELQRQAEFGRNVMVTTFAMDTDFYYQLPPYHELSDAKSFMEQFLEHIVSDHSGFYFPSAIKEELLSGFMEKVVKTVHEQVFSSSKEISRKDRLIFIDLVYLLIQLKVLEMVRPDSFSMTCKDAVDLGSVSSAMFYTFFKMMDSGGLSEEDVNLLRVMLFVPPLLIRERAMNLSRFNRMVSLLQTFEGKMSSKSKRAFSQNVRKAFSKLYGSEMFKVELLIPSTEEVI